MAATTMARRAASALPPSVLRAAGRRGVGSDAKGLQRPSVPFMLSRLHQVEHGEPGTLSYRVFLSQVSGEGQLASHPTPPPRLISPWHDIPFLSRRSLPHSPIFHFVNEIPRGSTAKYEIAADEEYTPIKQDTKKGQLRFLAHGPVLHNYGCLPQTWEDPSVRQTAENLPAHAGDNDPIDVIEVGGRTMRVGDVVEVKLLGALALVDEDECDWKLFAINTADPLASKWNDIGDLPKALVDNVREWYRVYKVAEGKPANRYALNGEAVGKDYARGVAEECHRMWRRLRKVERDEATETNAST